MASFLFEKFRSIYRTLNPFTGDTPYPQTNFKFVGNTEDKLPKPPHPSLDAIEQHKRAVLHAFTHHLYPFEIEYILSQKRRSLATEETTLADFWHGDIPYHHVTKDAHYYQALGYITAKFSPPHKFRPVHFLDVAHHYPHRWKSNAEAPFSTRDKYLTWLNNPIYRQHHSELPENPRRSFRNMKHIIFEESRRWIHEIKNGHSFNDYLFYILLHSKTALIDFQDPDKIRTIWGFPRMTNLALVMFFWPIMAWMKRNPGHTPILWGYETITGGMFKINAELFLSHVRGSIVTLDKSRFDKYLRFSVLDDIDLMVRSFLDFDNGYIPTKEYPATNINWQADNQAERIQRLWTFVCYAFRYTPIALYDGTLYQRTHAGMPSGVYTTQYYDTLYFGITNATTLFAMGYAQEQIVLYKGEGDDIIFKLSVLVQPNEHSAFLDKYSDIDSRYFGSLMRPEKSRIYNTPQGVEVLGYHNNHGMPERDLLDLLAQMYHTKMNRPTPSKTMATSVGIYYASMAQGTSRLQTALRNICKDIYDYYANQGYTPDESAFALTFYQDVHMSETITATTFPTPQNVKRQLMDFSYNTPETMNRFWPDWFLAQF